MRELREAYEAVRALAHTCLQCSDAATHANLGAVVGDWYFCDRHAAAHGAPELPYAAAIRAATAGVMTPRAQVFADVDAERTRQDEKWGEQNHPILPRGVILIAMRSGESPGVVACRLLGVPSEKAAREACEEAAHRGVIAYGHVFVEEVAELFEACAIHGETSDEARCEFVQVAAVSVAMVENVDRKRAAQKAVA